jgi:hypothetical protein
MNKTSSGLGSGCRAPLSIRDVTELHLVFRISPKCICMLKKTLLLDIQHTFKIPPEVKVCAEIRSSALIAKLQLHFMQSIVGASKHSVFSPVIHLKSTPSIFIGTFPV